MTTFVQGVFSDSNLFFSVMEIISEISLLMIHSLGSCCLGIYGLKVTTNTIHAYYANEYVGFQQSASSPDYVLGRPICILI